MRQKYSVTIKIISYIIISSLLSQNTVLAQGSGFSSLRIHNSPLQLHDIQLPENLGTIKEVWEPAENIPKHQKIFIHIQDSHCNSEAQMNIAKILEHIVMDYRINTPLPSPLSKRDRMKVLIAVEGAVGDIDTSQIRSFKSNEVKKTICDYLTKRGFMTGADYFSVFGDDKDFILWGAEDYQTYVDNLKLFRKSQEYKGDVLRFIKKKGLQFGALKQKLFSKDQIEFVEKIDAYHNDEMGMEAYALYLNPKLSPLKNYDSLVKLIELKKKINFMKIDEERMWLLKELKGEMEREDLVKVIAEGLNYQIGKTTAVDYFSHLEELIHRYISPLQFANLVKYADYLRMESKIDRDQLFAEIGQIENELRKQLFNTQVLIDLEQKFRCLTILKKFVNLKVYREDLLYYKENKEKFIQSLAVSNDLFLNTFEKFCDLGMERDRILVKNTIKKMEDVNVNIAILITGGFHTEGMTKILRKEGIPHAVVSPKMTKAENKQQYVSLMANKLSPFEKVLAYQGRKLQLFNPFCELTVPLELGMDQIEVTQRIIEIIGNVSDIIELKKNTEEWEIIAGFIKEELNKRIELCPSIRDRVEKVQLNYKKLIELNKNKSIGDAKIPLTIECGGEKIQFIATLNKQSLTPEELKSSERYALQSGLTIMIQPYNYVILKEILNPSVSAERQMRVIKKLLNFYLDKEGYRSLGYWLLDVLETFGGIFMQYHRYKEAILLFRDAMTVAVTLKADTELLEQKIAEARKRIPFKMDAKGNDKAGTYIQALYSDNVKDRREGYEELVLLGKDAVRPLTGVLRHENQKVRELARHALVSIGKDAVYPLRAALYDRNNIVVELAFSALVQIGRDAVKALSAVIYDEKIGEFARDALVLIGKDSVRVLTAIMCDEDEKSERRELARKTLLSIGNEALGPLVISLPKYKKKARKLIRKVISEIIENNLIPLLNSLNSENKEEREQAYNLLVPVAKSLVNTLGCKSDTIKRLAKRILIKIGEPAISPLTGAWKRDRNITKRNWAKRVMDQIKEARRELDLHTEHCSGAFQVIGPPLPSSVIKILRGKEDTWREEAKKVHAQEYSKNIKFPRINFGFTEPIKDIPVKVIQDKHLHDAVDAWHLWDMDDSGNKCLVIITRTVPEPEILDEIIFHEYEESRWIDKFFKSRKTEYLNDEEKENIVRDAHILTCVIQGQMFTSNSGITPLHKRHLDKMFKEGKYNKLQSLIDEYYRGTNVEGGRDYHRRLIKRKLPKALTDAEKYMSNIVDYVQSLLSDVNNRRLLEMLSLKDQSLIQILFKELQVELLTVSRETIDNIEINKIGETRMRQQIPVLIKNVQLLREQFIAIKQKEKIYANIEIYNGCPIAIRFQDELRIFIIDIAELSKCDNYEPLKEQVDNLENEYSLTGRPLIRFDCEYVDVNKWGIGRIPVLFNIYTPGNKGTEKLTDEILRYISLQKASQVKFLDLGVGAGIIAIAVANQNNKAHIVCADSNKTAVLNSKIAIIDAGWDKVIKVVESNIFDNLLGERFDVIAYDASGGVYLGEEVEERDTEHFEKIFYEFGDHLTKDGVLLLRVPFERDDIIQLMERFKENRLLMYEKVYSYDKGDEPFNIFKIQAPEDIKLYYTIGPLKIAGTRLSAETIHKLRKMEITAEGWREKAVNVESERYQKAISIPYCNPVNIDLRIKILRDTALPSDVYAVYFWTVDKYEKKCMVIVSHEDKEMLEKAKDEVVFYGYMHSEWTKRLIEEKGIEKNNPTEEEKETIRFEAHVLAVSQQALAFQQSSLFIRVYIKGEYQNEEVKQISPIHRMHLNIMAQEGLGEVRRVFESEGEGYRNARERYFNEGFLVGIREYERLIREYALERELEMLSKEGGLIVLKHKQGAVKECYIDWGGVLSDLKPWERRFLFQVLKENFGEGLKINILSTDDPEVPYSGIKTSNLLGYIDSIIIAGSIEIKDKEEGKKEIEVIRKVTNKISCITERLNNGDGRKVLFVDNDVNNFLSGSDERIIKILVTGRNIDRGVEKLIGRSDYCIRDITGLRALFQLILIQPQGAISQGDADVSPSLLPRGSPAALFNMLCKRRSKLSIKDFKNITVFSEKTIAADLLVLKRAGLIEGIGKRYWLAGEIAGSREKIKIAQTILNTEYIRSKVIIKTRNKAERAKVVMRLINEVWGISSSEGESERIQKIRSDAKEEISKTRRHIETVRSASGANKYLEEKNTDLDKKIEKNIYPRLRKIIMPEINSFKMGITPDIKKVVRISAAYAAIANAFNVSNVDSAIAEYKESMRNIKINEIDKFIDMLIQNPKGKILYFLGNHGEVIVDKIFIEVLVRLGYKVTIVSEGISSIGRITAGEARKIFYEDEYLRKYPRSQLKVISERHKRFPQEYGESFCYIAKGDAKTQAVLARSHVSKYGLHLLFLKSQTDVNIINDYLEMQGRGYEKVSGAQPQLVMLQKPSRHARIAHILDNEPDRLYLNITNRCTDGCVFDVKKFLGLFPLKYYLEGKEPSVEEIIEAIKSKGGLGKYKEIVFCGTGEPLLRLDVIKRVAKMIKSFLKIQFSIKTNGFVDPGSNSEGLKGLIDRFYTNPDKQQVMGYHKFCKNATLDKARSVFLTEFLLKLYENTNGQIFNKCVFYDYPVDGYAGKLTEEQVKEWIRNDPERAIRGLIIAENQDIDSLIRLYGKDLTSEERAILNEFNILSVHVFDRTEFVETKEVNGKEGTPLWLEAYGLLSEDFRSEVEERLECLSIKNNAKDRVRMRVAKSYVFSEGKRIDLNAIIENKTYLLLDVDALESPVSLAYVKEVFKLYKGNNNADIIPAVAMSRLGIGEEAIREKMEVNGIKPIEGMLYLNSEQLSEIKGNTNFEKIKNYIAVNMSIDIGTANFLLVSPKENEDFWMGAVIERAVTILSGIKDTITAFELEKSLMHELYCVVTELGPDFTLEEKREYIKYILEKEGVGNASEIADAVANETGYDFSRVREKEFAVKSMEGEEAAKEHL